MHRLREFTLTCCALLLCSCALPPLQTAAGSGDRAQVEKLLSSGANPSEPNAFGWTPLHNAAQHNPPNAPEIVKMLLDAGANPYARTFDGYTPIHTAAHMNRTEILKRYAAAGIDVEVRATDGRTPLDLARTAGSMDAAKYLESLREPAAPQPVAATGGTPRGVAVYPFGAKGGADGALAEGLTSVFAGKLAGSPCVRLVAEDIIRDLAKQQGLEQACGTEECQIDLASQARADVLVRGDLARIGETYVLTTIAVDLATRQTILSESARAAEAKLLDGAESLGSKVGGALSCGK